MAADEFEKGLWEVYEGRQTFDAFARRMQRHWERLAEYIARRWRLPVWASKEDVVQDLMRGAWEAVWEYKPEKGTSLGGYVVYNAVDRAKKRVHRYRGAALHRKADSNPSRMDLSYVQVFGVVDADRKVDAMLAQEPEQEQMAIRRENVERVLAACVSEQERYVVRALEHAGTLAEGAQRLYDDPTARRVCRCNKEEDAARVVVETALALVGRLGDQAA